MRTEVDILENDIFENYPEVLEILLRDHTTQNNIFWATDNYAHLGKEYDFHSPILTESITGINGNIIMPRVKKDKLIQQSRVKDRAEIFTPSWVCNAQNNLVDNAWFNCENVFNIEITNNNNNRTWKETTEKISFPEDKPWKHYVRATRMEISCGEAPYLASRYDTTTGEFIPIENRIGLLDRKLRVINENTETTTHWLAAVQIAYKNIYGFEWQGDSLLLARESLLITFIENYVHKFGCDPLLKSIQYIAYIISWNIWQMDGLKGVLPKSCKEIITENAELFGATEKIIAKCKGCENGKIQEHNGIYALIKDWKAKDLETNKKGRKLKYVDLIKKMYVRNSS